MDPQPTEIVAIIVGLVLVFFLGYLTGRAEARQEVKAWIRELFEPHRTNGKGGHHKHVEKERS